MTTKSKKAEMDLVITHTNVKLSLIQENPDQIRKAPVAESDTKSLEASLLSHGLLQNVVVTRDKKNYTIIAGNRRISILKKLATENKVSADMEIPCRILEGRSDSTEALEASIAENDSRTETNPVDRQEAYLALNMSVSRISERFGIPERRIKADLAIAGVHPTIKEAARSGDLEVTPLRIYALSKNQARQKEVFDRLGLAGAPDSIREALLGKGEYAGGSLGSYCDLAEYERRGGRVIEDMFSRDAQGMILPHAELIDVHILQDLARERLNLESNKIRGKGWYSVEYFESEREARLVLSNHAKILPANGTRYTAKEKSTLSVLMFCEEGKTQIVHGVDLQDQESYQQTRETAQEVESDCAFRESELAHGVEMGIAQPADIRATMQGHFARTRGRILREHITSLEIEDSYPMISSWLAAEAETHLLFPDYRDLFLYNAERNAEEATYSAEPLEFLLEKARRYHSLLKGRKTWKADGKIQSLVLQKIDSILTPELAKATGSFFCLAWNHWHPDLEYFQPWKRTELSWLAGEVAGVEAASFVIARRNRDEAAQVLADYSCSDKQAIALWKANHDAPDTLKAFAKWKPVGIGTEDLQSEGPLDSVASLPVSEVENTAHV